MTLRFLPEHALNVRLALNLAVKEAGHLAYSNASLFARQIDLSWVKDLTNQPEVAEKVEAFVSRFGRLQDQIGDKLIPRYAALLGEPQKGLLDHLVFAERMGLIESAEDFVAARKLRNALVHEYMQDPQIFLESLHAAHEACKMLFDTVSNVASALDELGVPESSK